MNISGTKRVTVPQLALIGATRGLIGFGAGLLLAHKFKSEQRKILGWSLLLSGLASTVPIAMKVFGQKQASGTQHRAKGTLDRVPETPLAEQRIKATIR